MSTNITVKYTKGKTTFEILCHAGTVEKFRDNKLGLDNVLVTDDIYKNLQKGEKAKSSELMAVFGTSNMRECLETMIRSGEYQISVAERREKVEQKRNEIIHYIHNNHIDPKTNRPHPLTRIQNAMDQIKPIIDPSKSAEFQSKEILKKMVGHLALKKSVMVATFLVPVEMTNKSMTILQKWGTTTNQQNVTDSNGNQKSSIVVEFIPGNYESILDDINKVTKWNYEMKIDIIDPVPVIQGKESTKKGKNNNKNKIDISHDIDI